jgi:hypothetical protein
VELENRVVGELPGARVDATNLDRHALPDMGREPVVDVRQTWHQPSPDSLCAARDRRTAHAGPERSRSCSAHPIAHGRCAASVIVYSRTRGSSTDSDTATTQRRYRLSSSGPAADTLRRSLDESSCESCRLVLGPEQVPRARTARRLGAS